jgi:succinate dehydrogenase/fumarate reductase flavoprotein subunit
MGSAVGAQLAKVGKAASRFIWACPDKKVGNLMMGSQCDAVGSDGTIVVNAAGRRFMDETLITKDPSRYFSYKNAVRTDITTLEYPNNPAYLIFDEAKCSSTCMVTTSQSTVAFGLIDWDEKNKNAIERGWLIKGDTIEELAEKIRDTHNLNMGRMDPENLVMTMSQYQEMVDTGIDTAFGRSSNTINLATGEILLSEFQPISTPPFYAMPLVAGGPNTKGGLQADGSCHVIDWSNKPISRLYSAGELSSCFKFVYQGGGNLTECIVCGRIAGEHAAAETDWSE